MIDAPYPRALLVALVLATGLALLVTGATSTASFGAFNPAWDGTADLRDLPEAMGAETELLQHTSAYTDLPPTGSVAIVLSPATAYANPAPVREFVTGGGTLLVAEDYRPHANSLLSAVGATARVDGRPLRDERTNGRSPAFPRATTVSDHPLTANVSALVLNHGTVVEPGTATVLVSTSSYGYLDSNRNRELDDAENLTSYPVATVEPVGAGRVIVVSDPSLFINAMLAEGSNRAFARAIVADHDRVAFDVSHAGAVPPLRALHLAIQDTPLIQLGLGGLVLAGHFRWRRLRALAGRATAPLRPDPPAVPRRTDSEAIAANVAARRPDWDQDRVQRITEAIMTRRSLAGDDDRPE